MTYGDGARVTQLQRKRGGRGGGGDSDRGRGGIKRVRP